MAFLKPTTFLYVVYVASATPVSVKRAVDKMASTVNLDEAGVRRQQGDGARVRFTTGATGHVLKDSALPSNDPIRRSVKDTLDLERSNPTTCTDTPGWNNGHGSGKTCARYVKEGWCHNHRVASTVNYFSGFNNNFPENNCCVCGKGCSDLVRNAFHSVLCRDPSFAVCRDMSTQAETQSWNQSQAEAAVRTNFPEMAAVSTCDEGIPACDGCEGKPSECFSSCRDASGNFKPGMCSSCDAVDGRKKGACCMRGRADDPAECHAVPSSYFKFSDYHECVIVDKPYPECTGCTPGEFNPRECWTQCGGSDTHSGAGFCSACNSASAPNGQAIQGSGMVRGACCRKDYPSDPEECRDAPAANFLYDQGHSCVLTEVPACVGCGAHPGECWNACNDTPGYCSACNSVGGKPGACCMRGSVDDPAECRDHVSPSAYIFNAGYHECVLTNQARVPPTAPPTPPPPTPAPTPTPVFDADLHSSGKVCETSSYTTVPLVNGEPSPKAQACNGWNMASLTINAGEEQCWQYCLSNTIAPGCESIQTAPCVASEYWTAYKVCHLHSSCDQPFHKQPGANTRNILTAPPTPAPPPTPPPTTPAPTREPGVAVSSAIQVHTASTAKPQSVRCSGTVTSDAHCVAWYKAEPEPIWSCEMFPDRSTAEHKFSGIEGTTAAAVMHNTNAELKYYGVIPFWDWNTLQEICKLGLTTLTPSSR